MHQPDMRQFQRRKDEAAVADMVAVVPGLGELQALRVIQDRRRTTAMAERGQHPSWYVRKTEG